jgi:Uma2 family endonuclease
MRRSAPEGQTNVANPKSFFSVQEYLDLERESETKHEYVDGRIVAMAGASANHGLIMFGVGGAIRQQLRGRGCYVYPSDLRVRIDALGIYTYPDVTVTCGTPQFGEERPDTLLNPALIVEILSPSTEIADRTTKFARYRRIPSFREYVLIAQDKPLIEHYVRQEEGTWSWSAAERLEESIYLPTIDCALALAEVYDQVIFSPDELTGNHEN